MIVYFYQNLLLKFKRKRNYCLKDCPVNFIDVQTYSVALCLLHWVTARFFSLFLCLTVCLSVFHFSLRFYPKIIITPAWVYNCLLLDNTCLHSTFGFILAAMINCQIKTVSSCVICECDICAF